MNQGTVADPVSGLLANLLVASIGVYAFMLSASDPDAYYLAVQEDGVLEWGTFWAFIAAAGVYIYVAVRRGSSVLNRWFPAGLALFCLLVAFEEISWGQRIIGYRPPSYFLEHNFQQEFNLHNVMDTQFRRITLRTIIYGYGVLLPLLCLIPALRRARDRAGIVSPPALLIPAFLMTGIGQQVYPLKYTGEWIELMLGGCFLFAAMSESSARAGPGTVRALVRAARLAGATCIVLIAGVASAMATDLQRANDPANIETARFELEALRRDFKSGKVRLRGKFHRRIYTYVEKAEHEYLYEGEYAQLTEQGLPEQRAEFFLDPWNYAYWIRKMRKTDDRPSTIYLYSFGPNRRRDSTRWEIRGDDIAVVVKGAVDDKR